MFCFQFNFQRFSDEIFEKTKISVSNDLLDELRSLIGQKTKKMDCPKISTEPNGCESKKFTYLEHLHLTSAERYKKQMIEKHFDNQVYQAYFTEELLGKVYFR